MVKSFLRMTQTLEKLKIIKFFQIIGSFLSNVWATSLQKKVLKNKLWLILVSPVGNFGAISAFVLLELA